MPTITSNRYIYIFSDFDLIVILFHQSAPFDFLLQHFLIVIDSSPI